MENNTVRTSLMDDGQKIDLKELFLYVCRKWRSLIVLGLIGVILGAGVGLYKAEPNTEDFDLEKLHLKEIEQYARYQALYEDELAWSKESILLNMDPNAAYFGSVTYYLQLKEIDSPVVSSLYNSILNDTEVLEKIQQDGGLDCSLRAIQELVGIHSTTLELQGQRTFSENRSVFVQVMAYALAPEAETCRSILDLLDKELLEMNKHVEATYGALRKERLETSAEKSTYSSIVADSKQESTDKLMKYATQISTIKKGLSEDDKEYYSLAYETGKESEETGLSWLKWGIILGVVFGGLGVFVYAVAYLLDAHIKNVDELLAYGLHPFAVIEGSTNGKKRNALDKLFTPELRYQSDVYLTEALEALDAERIVLCGDLHDSDIEVHGKAAVLASRKLSIEPQMAESADTQRKVKQADGVVLLVHLWKTKRTDLEQELRICQKLGGNVLGVAIIG